MYKKVKRVTLTVVGIVLMDGEDNDNEKENETNKKQRYEKK